MTSNATQRDADETRRKLHKLLDCNLHFFCKTALKIKAKAGGDVPFVWNKAQEYLHSRIEDQLRRIGKVRLFILKGRQQGISTYIAARLYRNVARQKGRNCFILSHHSTTTETLFSIVDKYQTLCPDSIKPKTITSNNRRLKLDNGSQYTVGTAGSGAIGRGDTNQFFHWSEVAFCDNIDELVTGVEQTVAEIDGTEVFKESTANGVGNHFHTGVMQALRGEGEYEVVFIPWYWQDEYRARVPENYEATDEEQQLKRIYGLDDAQIVWRRNKIAAFESAGFGPQKFKQEYPLTVEEAFQASGDQLFNPDAVAKARACRETDNNAPLILGVDPGPINDRTTIAWRRGYHLIRVESFVGLSAMELAGKLTLRIDKHEVDKVFIDIAEGRGAITRLHELGYKDVVSGIPFAMQPTDKDLYVNKRAEMAGNLKEWLEGEITPNIPDDELLAVELGAIPGWKLTSNGKHQLVAKEEIKKAYGKSPDLVDAVMLTFALPVKNMYNHGRRIKKATQSNRSESSVANRRRGIKQNSNTTDDDEYQVRRESSRNPRRR